jgi:hypothetical protein
VDFDCVCAGGAGFDVGEVGDAVACCAGGVLVWKRLRKLGVVG